MQISNDVQKIIQTYIREIDRAKSNTKAEKAKVVRRDEVKISSDAADIGRAKEVISLMSDLRPDKVAELRRKIEAGKYNPPPEDVARKIISHYLIRG